MVQTLPLQMPPHFHCTCSRILGKLGVGVLALVARLFAPWLAARLAPEQVPPPVAESQHEFLNHVLLAPSAGDLARSSVDRCALHVALSAALHLGSMAAQMCVAPKGLQWHAVNFVPSVLCVLCLRGPRGLRFAGHGRFDVLRFRMECGRMHVVTTK